MPTEDHSLPGSDAGEPASIEGTLRDASQLLSAPHIKHGPKALHLVANRCRVATLAMKRSQEASGIGGVAKEQLEDTALHLLSHALYTYQPEIESRLLELPASAQYRPFATGDDLSRVPLRDALSQGSATERAAAELAPAMARDLADFVDAAPDHMLIKTASLLSGVYIHPEGEASSEGGGRGGAKSNPLAGIAEVPPAGSSRWVRRSTEALTSRDRGLIELINIGQTIRILANAPNVLSLLFVAAPMTELLRLMAATAGLARRIAILASRESPAVSQDTNYSGSGTIRLTAVDRDGAEPQHPLDAAEQALQQLKGTATEAGQENSMPHRHTWYLQDSVVYPWPKEILEAIRSARGEGGTVQKHSVRVRIGDDLGSEGVADGLAGLSPGAAGMQAGVAAAQMQALLFLTGTVPTAEASMRFNGLQMQDDLAHSGASALDLLGCMQCMATTLQLYHHGGARMIESVFMPAFAAHPGLQAAFEAMAAGNFGVRSPAHWVLDAVNIVGVQGNRRWLYGKGVQARHFPNMQRHLLTPHPVMEGLMEQALYALLGRGALAAAKLRDYAAAGVLEPLAEGFDENQTAATGGSPRELPVGWPTELRSSRSAAITWARRQYTMRDGKDNDVLRVADGYADRAFQKASQQKNRGGSGGRQGAAPFSPVHMSATIARYHQLPWWGVLSTKRLLVGHSDRLRGVAKAMSRAEARTEQPFSVETLSPAASERFKGIATSEYQERAAVQLRGYLEQHGDKDQYCLLLGVSTAGLTRERQLPGAYWIQRGSAIDLLARDGDRVPPPLTKSHLRIGGLPSSALTAEIAKGSPMLQKYEFFRNAVRERRAREAIRHDTAQMRAVMSADWTAVPAFAAICPPRGSNVPVDDALAALASIVDATFWLGTSYFSGGVLSFVMEALERWVPLLEAPDRLSDRQKETLFMIASVVLNSVRVAEAGSHQGGYGAVSEILGHDHRQAVRSAAVVLGSVVADAAQAGEGGMPRNGRMKRRDIVLELKRINGRRAYLGSRMINVATMMATPNSDMSTRGGGVFLASLAVDRAVYTADDSLGVLGIGGEGDEEEEDWQSNSVADVLVSTLHLSTAGLLDSAATPADEEAKVAYYQLLGQTDCTPAALRATRASLLSADVMRGVAEVQSIPKVLEWITTAEALVRLGAICNMVEKGDGTDSADSPGGSTASFGIFEGTPTGAMLGSILHPAAIAVKAIQSEIGESWYQHEDKVLQILERHGVPTPTTSRLPPTTSIVDLARMSACGYFHPAQNSGFELYRQGKGSELHRSAFNRRQEMRQSFSIHKDAIAAAERDARSGQPPLWSDLRTIMSRPGVSGTEQRLMEAVQDGARQLKAQGEDTAGDAVFEAMLPGLGYRVDAAWPKLGLILEYDGPFHAAPQELPDVAARREMQQSLWPGSPRSTAVGEVDRLADAAPLAQQCLAGRNLTAMSARTGLRAIREYNRFEDHSYCNVMPMGRRAWDVLRERLLERSGWRVARFPFWMMYKHDPSYTAGVAGGYYGLLSPLAVKELGKTTLQHVISGPRQ